MNSYNEPCFIASSKPKNPLPMFFFDVAGNDYNITTIMVRARTREEALDNLAKKDPTIRLRLTDKENFNE